MTIKEEWRNVPGYPKEYFVSNRGRLKRVRFDGKEVFYSLNSKTTAGYVLTSWGDKKVYAHRMVALAFLPNPDNAATVNHKNLDKSDNRVENLEWASHKENINHARGILGNYNARGEEASMAKLTEAQVREIKELLKAGIPQRTIAKQFGISRGPVSGISLGLLWTHVIK